MTHQRRDNRVSHGAAPAYALTFVSVCALTACRHDTINIYAGPAGRAAERDPARGDPDAGRVASQTTHNPQNAAGAPRAQPAVRATQTAPSAGAAGTAVDVQPGIAGTSGKAAGDDPALEPKNSGWWMMGYDAHNWYWNPNEHALSVDNAGELRELWRAALTGTPNGTPVIAEGKVFVTSSGAIYGLDLATGQPLWTRTDITATNSFAYEAGAVYVFNLTPALLYKLSAEDGSTIWGPSAAYDADNSDGMSSPILADGKVIVGHDNGLREASPDPAVVAGARGGVEAFDMETGQNVWTYYTTPEPGAQVENGASVWSSVTIDAASGAVFATTGNNYSVTGPNSDAFHAIDLRDGQRRWVTQVRADDAYCVFCLRDINVFDMDFGANPVLIERAGKRIVAAGNKTSTFYALDADTGQILWARDQLSASHTALYGGIFIGGAYDGEAFYVVANDSDTATARVHKLDPDQQGASIWSQQLPAVTWGAQSVANGLLLVPNDTQLYVLDARTGDVLKRFETGGTIAGGAAAIGEGHIVVKSGLVYAGDVKDNNQVICYGVSETSKANE